MHLNVTFLCEHCMNYNNGIIGKGTSMAFVRSLLFNPSICHGCRRYASYRIGPCHCLLVPTEEKKSQLMWFTYAFWVDRKEKLWSGHLIGPFSLHLRVVIPPYFGWWYSALELACVVWSSAMIGRLPTYGCYVLCDSVLLCSLFCHCRQGQPPRPPSPSPRGSTSNS